MFISGGPASILLPLQPIYLYSSWSLLHLFLWRDAVILYVLSTHQYLLYQ